MSKFSEIVEIYETWDVAKVDHWLHDDFLFIKDFDMQTKEEYLEDTKVLFEQGFKMSDPKMVVENDDIMALSHIVADGSGQRFRVTAVTFFKDGKSWRLATSRVPVEI